jgi:hypothetical protein
VTAGGLTEHFPSWTPEGKILFLSERITDQQEHVNDILIIDADGQNAAVLYSGVPHGGPLEFRPDSATIAFQSPRAGNFDIYTTVLGQGPVAVEVPGSNPSDDVEIVEPRAEPTTAPVAPAATPASQAAASGAGGNPGIIAAIVAAVLGSGLVGLFLFRRSRP